MSTQIDDEIEDALKSLEDNQSEHDKKNPNNIVNGLKEMIDSNKKMFTNFSNTLEYLNNHKTPKITDINTLSEMDIEKLAKKVAICLSEGIDNTPLENIGYQNKDTKTFFNKIPFIVKLLLGVILIFITYLFLKFNIFLPKYQIIKMDIEKDAYILCNNERKQIFKDLKAINGRMINNNTFLFNLKAGNESTECTYKLKD